MTFGGHFLRQLPHRLVFFKAAFAKMFLPPGSVPSSSGDHPIGCDECEVWVYSTELCSGLSEDLIHAILSYGGEGIRFICMTCRLKPAVPARAHAEGAASTASSG